MNINTNTYTQTPTDTDIPTQTIRQTDYKHTHAKHAQLKVKLTSPTPIVGSAPFTTASNGLLANAPSTWNSTIVTASRYKPTQDWKREEGGGKEGGGRGKRGEGKREGGEGKREGERGRGRREEKRRWGEGRGGDETRLFP